MKSYPVLPLHRPHDPVARQKTHTVTCHAFLKDVASFAGEIPDKPYVINVSHDRYFFLVGFVAALLRGHITLLPPGRAPNVLEQLREEYQEIYVVSDQDPVEGFEHDTIKIPLESHGRGREIGIPSIQAEQVALIAFTSGSTGKPRPNLKTWGSMVEIAGKTGAALGLDGPDPFTVVATVPVQHMYGLETSVMLPLQHGGAVHSGRPFFPEDIRGALSETPGDRLLVTTPYHLRACVAARIPFPEVKMVISATAPLSRALARESEAAWKTTVMEVYGFVEAGSMAVRQTVAGERWRALEGLRLEGSRTECRLRASYFHDPVPLPDVVELQSPSEFLLIGRGVEFLNIAGHRVALGDLNQKLSEVKGVLDGVFVMPDEVEGQVTRPMAFVVAPGKTEQEIFDDLRAKIDSVFLPRPLFLVDALPRNETGKVPREALLTLAKSLVLTTGSGTAQGPDPVCSHHDGV